MADDNEIIRSKVFTEELQKMFYINQNSLLRHHKKITFYNA